MQRWIIEAMAAAASLLFSICGVRADDFEDRIRTALALTTSVQVSWPPHSFMGAGVVLLPDGSVTDRIQTETKETKRNEVQFAVEVPSARLLPVEALWQWRAVVAAADILDIRLIVRDVVVETVDESLTPPPLQDGRQLITTAWRAALVLEARPKQSTPREKWSALIDTVLQDAPSGLEIGPNSIRMDLGRSVIAIEAPAAAAGAPKPERAAGPKRWAFATIASGKYAQLVNLNQPWNSESANLVRSALSDWKPFVDRSLAPANGGGIARDQVLSFVDGFTKQAKAGKAELLVVYYIGHMERTRTGGLSLLMSDAPSERDTRPPAPSGIGNLRDLAQVIDQATAELAPDAGTLDAAVLHRRVGKVGIPFVLLIDGCLEDRSYAAARDRLGIVVDARGGQPLYIGPGDAASALRTILSSLSAYPQDFPWLRSRDATVLGATPGTLAYSEPHPLWLLGAPAAPIAKRLAGAVARTRFVKDRPNLIRILSFAADRQPIGPQELVGTVSWSDWLPLLRRFDPASFKR